MDIDGINETLLFLYADDLIIFANNYVDLKRKLKILGEYGEAFNLPVNISKTKVIAFRKGGPLPAVNHNFELNGDDIEIVSKYVYLGVKFTTSGLGWAPARVAVGKAKAVSAAALTVVAKLQADS